MKAVSLRTRLLVGTAAWLLPAFLLGGIALSAGFRSSVENAFDARLESLLMAVVAAVDAPPGAPVTAGREIPDPAFERAYSGWYWQVSDGERRLRSPSLWDAVLPAVNVEGGTDTRKAVVTGPRDMKLRVLERRVQYPGRAEPVSVMVTAPEAELQRQVDSFDRLLALSLTALAATLLIAIAIQVRFGLRPFARLRSELGEVRSAKRKVLGRGYPAEIEELVSAMNEVLEKDAGRIARAREQAGNLAHGLKTPLAVLTLEAARKTPDGERIAEQVSRISSVVEYHLARAAAAESHQSLGSRTDVDAVVDDLTGMLARIHAGRPVAFEIDVPADLQFAGERHDLEEMLGNVIDNAARLAASTVSVRAGADGQKLEIIVEDDGPGMTADEATASLRRGARDHETGPGSGLGLSITNELAAHYHGSLELERGSRGGLQVKLRLPLAGFAH